MSMDTDKIQQGIRLFLEGIGEDPEREGLRDTPARVARMWEEFEMRKAFSMAFFSNGEKYDELVLVKDIPFYSFCEHHILPFGGKVHIAYIPNIYMIGLSKLARVVDHYALGLNIQEELTCKIASYLNEKLSPMGIAVIIEAEHLCMSMRGVQKPGHKTITSRLVGSFFENNELRNELMQLIRG